MQVIIEIVGNSIAEWLLGDYCRPAALSNLTLTLQGPPAGSNAGSRQGPGSLKKQLASAYSSSFPSLVKQIITMAKELAKGIQAQGRSKSYHRR